MEFWVFPPTLFLFWGPGAEVAASYGPRRGNVLPIFTATTLGRLGTPVDFHALQMPL